MAKKIPNEIETLGLMGFFGPARGYLILNKAPLISKACRLPEHPWLGFRLVSLSQLLVLLFHVEGRNDTASPDLRPRVSHMSKT